MSTQIAIRLPDELVERIDALVREGAPSRAAVVASALERHLQRLVAERDAEIYRESGDYADLDGLTRFNFVSDLD